jgi:replication-associated recombination protein RarA
MGDEVKMDVVDSASSTVVDKVEKDTMPWVEKYRPKSLTELIAHEEIIQILNKLIESNKLPHLLFYGPPGTGSLIVFLYFRFLFILISTY